MTTKDDKERLLSILDAHGRQFLSAFDVPAAPKHEARNSDASDSEEEWRGLDSSPNRGTSEGFSESENDDDFTASSSRIPDVTVFAESARERPTANLSAREHRKSFMSSKVSHITMSTSQAVNNKKILDEESDDERTHAQNDALLHRLVHTKLLSGSLNPDLDLNHAQKGRALAGRVLELAGAAKLGKGESVCRKEQRNKAGKRVRDGLIRKQKEQDQKALEEAKNLGNYHPTLKRIYDSNLGPALKKKRARGLGMGVGTFVGGTLKLSREEIASVAGSEKRSRDKGRLGKRQRPHQK